MFFLKCAFEIYRKHIVGIAVIEDQYIYEVIAPSAYLAVGITCLVGILAAIDSVLFSMVIIFQRLGANSFHYPTCQRKHGRNNSGRVEKESDPISFDQAMSFKDHYKFADATTALYLFGNSSATIRIPRQKTNPTTRVLGIDENYLRVSAYEIDFGKKFNTTETQYNTSDKAIIGSDMSNIYLMMSLKMP